MLIRDAIVSLACLGLGLAASGSRAQIDEFDAFDPAESEPVIEVEAVPDPDIVPVAADTRVDEEIAEVLPGRTVVAPAVDLFASHSWRRPTVVAAPVNYVAVAPQAPVAPPLPFKYLGRYEQDGEETVYILSRADRVYDVKLGDTIDATYTVDGVEAGRLVFVYRPLMERQGLSLGELK